MSKVEQVNGVCRAGWQLLEARRSTSENSDPETLGAAVKSEWQFVWSARPDASTASWARYIDAPVFRDRNNDLDNTTGSKGKSGSGLDERLYYTTDANMNVTALVNTDGTVAERYRYDPYGNCTVLKADWTLQQVSGHADGTASAYDNPILYCGYYRDAETGLYHVRNRMYHPPLGRWVQRDPVDYTDGPTLYGYADANPMAYTDPLGLQKSSPDFQFPEFKPVMCTRLLVPTTCGPWFALPERYVSTTVVSTGWGWVSLPPIPIPFSNRTFTTPMGMIVRMTTLAITYQREQRRDCFRQTLEVAGLDRSCCRTRKILYTWMEYIVEQRTDTRIVMFPFGSMTGRGMWRQVGARRTPEKKSETNWSAPGPCPDWCK